MKKYIHEIFKEIANEASFKQRVEILKKNNSKALRDVLKYSFDSSLKNNYTTLPKYKSDNSPIGLSYNDLFSSSKKLYLFFGKRTHPNDKKREDALVGQLETMFKDEAIIFGQVVTKKLKQKNITEFLVRKAFPRLLTEREDEK